MSTLFNLDLKLLILTGLVYLTAIKVPPLKSMLNSGPLFIISEKILARINALDRKIVNLDLLIKSMFELLIICIYILKVFIDFLVIV